MCVDRDACAAERDHQIRVRWGASDDREVGAARDLAAVHGVGNRRLGAVDRQSGRIEAQRAGAIRRRSAA
jgi:hypothetical protein